MVNGGIRCNIQNELSDNEKNWKFGNLPDNIRMKLKKIIHCNKVLNGYNAYLKHSYHSHFNTLSMAIIILPDSYRVALISGGTATFGAEQ